MPGASLALFADLEACHVQKSSVTICVLSALPVKRYRRSISIHALRVKGDPALFRLPISFPNFYPRPPGGGRPLSFRSSTKRIEFLSTPSGWRATTCCLLPMRTSTIFLSTPSGWRATCNGICLRVDLAFLSTPSGWRATREKFQQHIEAMISIHALRVEGDGIQNIIYKAMH